MLNQPQQNKTNLLIQQQIEQQKRSPNTNFIGSDTRRSSAVGITHRPPLPPNIETRSQSLDGLLDAAGKKPKNVIAKTKNIKELADEGVSDDKIKTTDDSQTMVSPLQVSVVKSNSKDSVNNRRSKSLEDLLDEHDEVDGRSKSMESVAQELIIVETKNQHNLEDSNNNHTENKKSTNSLISEKPCEKEILTVTNTMKETTPEKNNDDDEYDNLSTASRPDSIHSQPSTASSSFDHHHTSNSKSQSQSPQKGGAGGGGGNAKNTFLNRYVKKVKSLIKK